MKVVVYGKQFGEEADQWIRFLYQKLGELGIESITHYRFAEFLSSRAIPDFDLPVYHKPGDIVLPIDFLISVGGDGTILDTISSVGNSAIPIVGINTGRLGFLANNSKEDVSKVLDQLVNNDFKLQERSLLTLDTEDRLFGDFNFALNEITIHKKDSSSMITLHTYVNGEFLNSYWADGLIISTPTGSTAYSLSCGGPILEPTTKNFIINPIAPHNLTARPIIIPDDCEITVEVEGRDEEFLVTLDSRYKSITNRSKLKMYKSNFYIHLVEFEDQNFYKTIRNKLLWGQDKRN
ncbi:MAG: NAD kinase [Flavobacteriales bacterium]|nr:NAD kinase [Flavobacteriales bacterium]MCB9197484.1 NAD kinase [Flavobacteriales bacterium]